MQVLWDLNVVDVFILNCVFICSCGVQLPLACFIFLGLGYVFVSGAGIVLGDAGRSAEGSRRAIDGFS